MADKRHYMQRLNRRTDEAERRDMTQRLAEERGVDPLEIKDADVTAAIDAAKTQESQDALQAMLEAKLGRGQG